MSLALVKFPDQSAIFDIPASLRKLAEEIEAGEHGDCHNLAWVIDTGVDGINTGLMGKAAEPGLLFYYLAGLAMRKIEGAA